MKESIREKLEHMQDRYEELTHLLSDADTIADQDKFKALSKEYALLEQHYAKW